MQRSITDSEGRQWDVTVGRESYGMQVLLFFPRFGGGTRKAMLASSTQIEALAELDGLDEITLRERLKISVAWEDDILGSL